ncbi:MAG: class I SAM-dependent methyltransferase [Solirubrobacteraceae bacterium]
MMLLPTAVASKELISRLQPRRFAAALQGGVPELLWNVGQRFGYAVVPRGPFSPVPDVPPMGDPVWSRRASLPGVEFDLDAQLDFIDTELARYVHEFDTEVRGRGFELWNTLFQAGDAELLYALVRHLKPRRMIEVGSGHSTRVSAAAALANARDGSECELVAIDPHPRTEIAETYGLSRLEMVDCRAVGFDPFQRLEAGDVLFVDTTHVVKLGSEVNWLILEVLPRLEPGVWVHFHDIFAPHEYPWYMFVTAGILNEQYLLEALLLGNQWRVELANAALFIERHDALVNLVPSLKERVPGVPELQTWLPSSFWMRRTTA